MNLFWFLVGFCASFICSYFVLGVLYHVRIDRLREANWGLKRRLDDLAHKARHIPPPDPADWWRQK